MIEANELRIGNILQVDKFYWRVEDIITDRGQLIELYFEENPEYNHALHALPIPLTPEILEKCGFQRWPNENIFDHPKVTPHIDISLDRFDVVVPCQSCNGGEYLCTIHHLHQLQNFYFALGGEELQINL